MKGIYYKDGIYVLIDNDIENDNCVYHFNYRDDVSLLGGRVEIKYSSDGNELAYLNVDGKPIINILDNRVEKSLSISEITSHLNAMAANGIDAFLENYKKSIEFAYGELKELKKETEFQLSSESNDTNINNLKSELHKLKEMLLLVLGTLFSFQTYMSAGLENEKVLSVCQSIIDSFA